MVSFWADAQGSVYEACGLSLVLVMGVHRPGPPLLGLCGACLPGPSWGNDSVSVCTFQNQLLTKGMVILRDKIRFYEGEWPHCLLAWLLGIGASAIHGGATGVPLGALALPALPGPQGSG